jgi:LPS export ABC transporter permease LptF
MKLVDRYLLREMAWPFVGGLLAFVVMITGHMLFQAVEVMVEHRVALADVLRYLAYQVPTATVLALPVSTLLAVGLGTNRLAADSELLAMRVAGLTRRRMLLPGFCIGLAATGAALALHGNVVPWAEAKSEMLIRTIAFGQQAILVRPNEFINPGHGVVFYVHSTDPATGELRDVRVFYEQPDGFPMLIVARRAWFEDRLLSVGRSLIYTLSPKGEPTMADSSRSSIDLAEIRQAARGDANRLQAMTFGELRMQAERVREQGLAGQSQYSVELHSRLAFALSCLVFAILAVPIVNAVGHTQSLVGLLATLLIIFVYYVLMLWVRMFADQAVIPPYGVWALDIIIAGIALGFLWRQR